MSTSLLYHGFGIRDYKYVKTEYGKQEVKFTITKEREKYCCATCGSYDVNPRGSKERTFRSNPMGPRQVEIVCAIPRVECKACGELRQIKIQFADPQKSYTRGFERYALDLSKVMTIQDVATHLRVSWDMIKDIQKANLNRRFGKPKLKHIKHLAIDEISIGKKHKYLTVVMDLDSGAVVFVGEGKGEDALNPFWRRLKSSQARIEAVAMDMSRAYIKAVTSNLPEAVIVFDHFHLIKLFNDRLSGLRRSLYRKASESDREVMKGIHYLLLKNPENLDSARNEKERLEKALRLNEPLNIAYYMKGELRQLWKQISWESAYVYLTNWI